MRNVLLVSAALVVALLLVTPWASEHPDGLEYAIEQYADAEEPEAPGWALFPDYEWRSGDGGTVVAGFAGAGVVLLLGWALGRTRPARDGQPPQQPR